jgi:hypothetical protein
MLYRKAPLGPPRFLLRIATTASTGALLVMSGCSSSSSAGVVAEAPSDASEPDAAADVETNPLGVMVNPEGGPHVCTGLCGEPPGPPALDGGESDADAALPGDAASDAGADATGPCHPVCGIVVLVDE